jgi:hypothetical protein
MNDTETKILAEANTGNHRMQNKTQQVIVEQSNESRERKNIPT